METEKLQFNKINMVFPYDYSVVYKKEVIYLILLRKKNKLDSFTFVLHFRLMLR